MGMGLGTRDPWTQKGPFSRFRPSYTMPLGCKKSGPISPNVVIILSASSCDFWQCPWEMGSVTAERAGQGEVGGCTRRVQTALPCLGSTVERSWSALGGPFPPFLA